MELGRLLVVLITNASNTSRTSFTRNASYLGQNWPTSQPLRVSLVELVALVLLETFRVQANLGLFPTAGVTFLQRVWPEWRPFGVFCSLRPGNNRERSSDTLACF